MNQQNKNKNPFRVPDNYFAEVNRKILSATSESEDKQVNIFRKYRPFLSAAAVLAGFVVIGFIAMKFLAPPDNYPELSEIMTDEIELYIRDIDLHPLEKDEGLSGLFEESPEVNSDDIIDFLLNEDIQISEIFEEF